MHASRKPIANQIWNKKNPSSRTNRPHVATYFRIQLVDSVEEEELDPSLRIYLLSGHVFLNFQLHPICPRIAIVIRVPQHRAVRIDQGVIDPPRINPDTLNSIAIQTSSLPKAFLNRIENTQNIPMQVAIDLRSRSRESVNDLQVQGLGIRQPNPRHHSTACRTQVDSQINAALFHSPDLSFKISIVGLELAPCRGVRSPIFIRGAAQAPALHPYLKNPSCNPPSTGMTWPVVLLREFVKSKKIASAWSDGVIADFVSVR